MKTVKKVKGVHHEFKWKNCPVCNYKNSLAARRCKDCSFWFVKHCVGCGHPSPWEAENCHACNEPFYEYCRKDGTRIIEAGGIGVCEEGHKVYRICDVCGLHYPMVLEKCPFCTVRARKAKEKVGGGS